MKPYRFSALIFLIFSLVANSTPGNSSSAAAENTGFQPTIGVVDISENPPKAIFQQTASPSLYPAAAKKNELSGYVVVEFTVSAHGGTDNIKVLEAQPPGVFDTSAIRAVTSFKYKPIVVDGRAVENPGVVKRLTFGLAP